MKPFAMPSRNLRPYTSASFLALLFFVFLSVAPLASAQEPLVQCTGPGGLCTLCDLYAGTRRVINYMLFYLALPLSVIVIIASGIFFLTSAGSEERVTRAKSILWYGVLGLLLAFSAWVIVNTILTTLGFKGNWASFAICATAPFGPGAPGAQAPGVIGPPLTQPQPTPPGTVPHDNALSFLKSAGIDVRSSGGCLGENKIGCTSLQQAPAKALVNLIQTNEAYKKATNCTFWVSGGTETAGHGQTTEHGPGKGTFDLQIPKNCSYTTLAQILRGRGYSARCEGAGSEKSIDCGGRDGPVNHLHVSGL